MAVHDLLDLYAWTATVQTLASEIRPLLSQDSSTLDYEALNLIDSFQATVYEFVKYLDSINLNLIQIYKRSAAMKIDVLLRKDLRLLDVFSVRVAERNHLDFLKLRGRLNSLRRLLGTDSSLDGWTTKELNARSDNQSALQQVEGLATAAESCRGVIAQLVAENWSFRDAAAVVPGRRKK